MTETSLLSSIFNIEGGAFPFEDDHFDVVLFCEIIEHLTNDPLVALREIKRVLKPDGVLVLTTPNVNRLENVIRMIQGSTSTTRIRATARTAAITGSTTRTSCSSS